MPSPRLNPVTGSGCRDGESASARKHHSRQICPYTERVADIDLHAALFRGFSELSRLSILKQLRSGERRVSDIVAATGLTQSNVSTHLACLWDCGLVARERRGREVYYRLIEGVAELLEA